MIFHAILAPQMSLKEDDELMLVSPDIDFLVLIIAKIICCCRHEISQPSWYWACMPNEPFWIVLGVERALAAFHVFSVIRTREVTVYQQSSLAKFACTAYTLLS